MGNATRWMMVAAMLLGAMPAGAVAHDHGDQGTGDRGVVTTGERQDPDEVAAQAALPARGAAVEPGDGFGAASPEIFEPEGAAGEDAAARQHNAWLESIWNEP